jgi:hypothetical protein
MRNTPHSSPGSRKLLRSALVAALAAGCFTLRGAGADRPSPRVTVVFEHPEKYDDIRLFRIPDSVEEVKDRETVLAMFRDYVSQRAAAYLPEGQQLYIRFTNIRLAGQFPPGGIRDTRVISRNFPPEFEFDWNVTTASGEVLKKGSEHLFDPSFLDMHSDYNDIDRFFYEKAVLNDWMREKLRK